MRPPVGRLRLASGEDEDPPLPVHDGRNRRCVARSPLVPRTPDFAAPPLIEGDHARSARRADVQDERAAFEERRRRRAEEVLGHAVFGSQIAPPRDLARCELETVKLPFCAERVHAAAALAVRARSPGWTAGRCCTRTDPRRRTGSGTASARRRSPRRGTRRSPRRRRDGRTRGDRRRWPATRSPSPGKLPYERRRQCATELRFGRDGVVGRAEERRPVRDDGVR